LPVFASKSQPAANWNGLAEPISGKEDLMTLTVLLRATALAATVATVATGVPTGAAAQTTAVDPHHPGTLAQTTPPAAPGNTAGQDQGAQPGQPGMMPPGTMGQGMMGQGMMDQGMMGGMMQPGMMGAMPMMRMHAHMMKIMFAIADTDGDGALSFEEITTIEKRIFDKVDANKDGKVTPEEVQTFMRE
jgi:EF hand domain-containing protein